MCFCTILQKIALNQAMNASHGALVFFLHGRQSVQNRCDNEFKAVFLIIKSFVFDNFVLFLDGNKGNIYNIRVQKLA